MESAPLIDQIYEAAALPQSWPDLLSSLSDAFGTKGGLVFTQSAGGTRWVSSPAIAQLVQDYIDAGWMADNERIAPLIRDLHHGFQTDSDGLAHDRMAEMPVYRDFLAPRGVAIGAGTIIQGVNDDAMVLTLEGFESEAAVRAAIPALDTLRPHLARAMSLSARVAIGRSRAVVEGLAAVGTAAAVVGGGGRLRAANARFADRLGNLMIERRQRLSFTDPVLDRGFARVVTANQAGAITAQSLLVPGDDAGLACVIHILPLRGRAPDIFESDGLLLLLADGSNASLPKADLLRMLFDLTAAEARLTRHLLEGYTLAESAARHGIAESTARAQLKAVFAKTGINRQAELVRVLSSYAAPA